MSESLSFRLGQIIAKADGGCQSCALALAEKIMKECPEIETEPFKKGLLQEHPRWNNDLEEIDEVFAVRGMR